MNTCRNPECGKEIPDNMHYCNENCLRRHQEMKRQEREQAKANTDNALPNQTDENKQIDPNEGTKSKTVLKNKALQLISTYPDGKTLKQYASRLCWDISASFRTALEGYIEPMVEKKHLVAYPRKPVHDQPKIQAGDEDINALQF
jgi:hypothetical protein